MGVAVRVGEELGLGEMVQVGVRVLVGRMVCVSVAVFVSLGENVGEAVGLVDAARLQAPNTAAANTLQNNRFSCVLPANVVYRCNREKRVMINDFTF